MHFWSTPFSFFNVASFGQSFALRMTKPASYDMVEWSNIDGGGRGGGTSDIPSIVFCTVSKELFATLSQVILARIVVNKMLISLPFLQGIQS